MSDMADRTTGLIACSCERDDCTICGHPLHKARRNWHSRVVDGEDDLPTDAEFLGRTVRQWQSGRVLHPEMVEFLLAKAGAGPPYGEAPRELLCEDCNREYVVWFAANDLWNRVVRAKYTDRPEPFLCPTCFTLRCDGAGIEYTAFEVRVEPLPAKRSWWRRLLDTLFSV